MTKITWRHIGFMLLLHTISLSAMGLCRVLCLVYNTWQIGIEWSLAWRAMLIGIKFDNLVACYIASLPLLVITLLPLLMGRSAKYGRVMSVATRATGVWYGVLFAVVLFVSVADARYYYFFDNHLNVSVTEWFGWVDETAGMLFQDTTNRVFLLIAVVLILLYEVLVVRVTRTYAHGWHSGEIVQSKRYVWQVVVSILLWGACFCGIRGSFQRYPLGVSFAYFCNNAFYNKLGVNPIFNIIKSAEYTAQPMPDILLRTDIKSALRKVQDELGFAPVDTLYPLYRKVAPVRNGKNYNVVVILMESMSSARLDEMYNGRHLTPYLSSLRDSALYFSNFYSAGVHTNNGITASLYGFLPNFSKTTMRVPSDLYMGLPYNLQKRGYENYVFLTSNPNYDNMNSFFYDNHIKRIFSLYDYPLEEAVNNFGVPDGYLFEYGLRYLNARNDSTPFFALFLTVSNHSPFVVQDDYRCAGGDDEQCVVAYADGSIADFMQEALQTEWGKNTLFVLVGDHGDHVPSMYDYNVRANSVPCFIVGRDVPCGEIAGPAMQVDIAPTILGLLGQEYENNTMGIDLLAQSRPYAYFVNNDHLGCSDGVWLYSYSINSQKEYLYKVGSAKDWQKEEAVRLHAMRTYAAQHMLVNLSAVHSKWINPCE